MLSVKKTKNPLDPVKTGKKESEVAQSCQTLCSAGGVENRLEGPDRSRLACEEVASMQGLAVEQ